MNPVANGFETAREAGRYVELRRTRQILEQSGESATALCSGRGRGECAAAVARSRSRARVAKPEVRCAGPLSGSCRRASSSTGEFSLEFDLKYLD